MFSLWCLLLDACCWFPVVCGTMRCCLVLIMCFVFDLDLVWLCICAWPPVCVLLLLGLYIIVSVSWLIVTCTFHVLDGVFNCHMVICGCGSLRLYMEFICIVACDMLTVCTCVRGAGYMLRHVLHPYVLTLCRCYIASLSLVALWHALGPCGMSMRIRVVTAVYKCMPCVAQSPTLVSWPFMLFISCLGFVFSCCVVHALMGRSFLPFTCYANSMNSHTACMSSYASLFALA